MARLPLALAFVLLLASAVQAQSVAKWTERVYNAGAAQPLSAPIDLIVGTNVVCGLDPTTLVSTPNNPGGVAWDDPAATGKSCKYTDSGTGPLRSTPVGGSYEVTLTATSTDGLTSAESARVPFTHPGVSAGVPSGLRPVR